ncbi:MAG: exosortase family protein XrtG [Lachnospiraceae bacterium]
MKIGAYLLIIVVWLYILSVMKRCKLYYGHFVTGSFGLFILSMLLVRPIAIQPLARVVAAIAGLFGDLTGTFTAFFKYGILFISTDTSSITLQIDFECSGIIEILAFLSLLAFFTVYTVKERVLVGISGCICIILSNVLRIIVICEMIHFFGVNVYFIAHAIVGRIVFYMLSVLLYFYVFTKSQIIRTKLGKFSYGHN